MIALRCMNPRPLITRAGGLYNQAGLAKRWGVSKQYVSKAVRHSDFPAPILIEGNGEAWLGREADGWRYRDRR